MRDVPPLYIGRDNALTVIGRKWRTVQDIAAALGVRPRRVGRIALYPASELVAAIEGANPAADGAADADSAAEADELEAMRERIRKAG